MLRCRGYGELLGGGVGTYAFYDYSHIQGTPIGNWIALHNCGMPAWGLA